MKKTLCVLLSVCMLLPLFTCAAAAKTEPAAPAAANPYPLLIVRGMDLTKGLRYNLGTPEETDVNVMNALDAGALMKALARAFGALITKGRSAAVSVVTDYAYSLFAGYACDENGDSLDPAVTSPSYPEAVAAYPELWEEEYDGEDGFMHAAADRYGAENVYYFIYDWRLDAYENAAALNETVNRALAAHNCDKADVVCCSMGGIVTLAYLAYYGAERIDTLVSVSSTLYGTDVTTDLFQGRVNFDAAAAARFLKERLGNAGVIAPVLYKSKVLTLLCNFINRFAEKYQAQIYGEVLVPVFGTMPAMWELVQPEQYEAAKAFTFGDNADAYAGLLAKTDKVQREAVSRRKEILDAALAGGMKFAVLASYNSPNAPAYASAALQGDGTLETRWTALGALVSEVGGKLSAEELAVGDPKYVSADGCINASTCAYPDYTWFTKDAGHIPTTYGSDYDSLVFALLESSTQPTVTTWKAYPQFMQAQGTALSPLTDAPGRWDN